MIDASDLQAPPARTLCNRDILKGLAWREWLAWGPWFRGFFAVWLVCTWVLMIFFHPGFVLGFGCLYAMVAGVCSGALETIEGSEEFALSLPPTRTQKCQVKLLLGGGTLLAMTVIGTLAVALDLPQAVWGIFVQTGFTRPYPHVEHAFLYSLDVAAPLAVYAMTFLLGSIARTRGLATASPLLGLLSAGALCGLALLLEWAASDDLTGWFSVPALLIMSAAATVGAYQLYLRKEGINRPSPLGRRRLWWIWIIVGIVLLLFFLTMVTYRASRKSSSELAHMATVAGQARIEAENRREAAHAEALKVHLSTSGSRPAEHPDKKEGK